VLETEVKIKLSHPRIEDLEKELIKNNFKFINEEIQEDIYFNSIYKDFKLTDEALRIRVSKDKAELTYKGPKLSSDIKVREELSCEIKDVNSMISILEKLGFLPKYKINKKRKNYMWGKYIISLDIVENLGEFIEIEANDVSKNEFKSFVSEFVEKFGIKGEVLLKSYLEIMLGV
jgi:adenylate cyclase class 2